MIPLGVRTAITLVGVLLFAGSFVLKTSVDRGTRITHDVGPDLNADARAFTIRAMGAVIMMAGLLTWVVAFTAEHHTGIF